MTELWINGLRTDLPTDFKFTLTVENPYFSQTGSFSYDITLPLTTQRNAKIFGPLWSKRTRRKIKTYSGRIVVDNKVVASGTFVVTEVTDKEVTIQFLGGNSQINYKFKTSEVYIDELDLGTPDEIPLGEYTPDEYGLKGELPLILENVSYAPVYNEAEGKFYNRMYVGSGEDYNVSHDILRIEGEVIPQPRLHWLVKKIFSCLGYKTDDSQMTSLIYRNLYTCVGSVVDKVARYIPHWTVAEFIENLENMFNIVVMNEGDTMVLTPKRNFYPATVAQTTNGKSRGREEITKLLQDFSVTYDVETDEDSGTVSDNEDNTPNRGYPLSFPDWGKDFLGSGFRDYIVEGTIVDFMNIVDKHGSDYLRGVIQYDPTYSTLSYFYKSNGEYNVSQKNACGGLDNQDPTRDSNIDLNFLPTVVVTYTDKNNEPWTCASVPGDGYLTSDDDPLIIEDCIGQNTEPTKFDKSTNWWVAFDYTTWTAQNLALLHSIPSAIPTHFGAYTLKMDDTRYLSLSPRVLKYTNLGAGTIDTATTETETTIAAHFYLDSDSTIDKTIAVEFQFADDKLLDVTKTFTIAGNTYACEKVEYEITATGISPIKKGTFYAIKR